MVAYNDVEEMLRKYDSAYDRVKRLKALCHKDEEEAGRWLWEAFRKGEDVVDDSWYWDMFEDAAEASYDLGDFADLLLAIGKSPDALDELEDGWHQYLEYMLNKKFDAADTRLIDVFNAVPEPLKLGLGFTLAARDLLPASDLPAGALEATAGVLVDGLTYDKAMNRALEVFGVDALGPALAVAGSQRGVSIWSTIWVPLAVPHATSAQRAMFVLNLDYARTAAEMADVVLEHYVHADYAEIERQLVELVAIENIDYYDSDAPAQKLGLTTAAIVLALHAQKSGGTVGPAGLKAWERSIKYIPGDVREKLVEAFSTLPLAERERIALPLFAKEYSDCPWELLGVCQTPAVVAEACRVVRELPRGDRFTRAWDAFAELGPEVAQTLVDAGWSKVAQREILAVGLAATGSPLVIDRLIELLEDGLDTVREIATEALHAQLSAARERLMGVLGSRKKTVRLGAAQALLGASLSDDERASIEAMADKEKIDEVEIALRALLDAPSGADDVAVIEVDADAVASLADQLYKSVPRRADDFDPSLWRASIDKGDVFLHAALDALCRWWLSSEHRAAAWSLVVHEAQLTPAFVPTMLDAISDPDRTGHATVALVLAGLRERLGDEAAAPTLAHVANRWADDETLDWLVTKAPEDALAWAQEGFLGEVPVAARLLERLGEQGRSALAGFVTARRADVRIAAVNTLMQRPGEDLKPLFTEALESDRSAKVKDVLRAALYDLEVADRPSIEELEATAANHSELDNFLAGNGTPPPKGTDLDALPPLGWVTGADLSPDTVGWILTRIDAEGPGDSDLQALRRHLDPAASAAFLSALQDQFTDTKEARLGWVLSCNALFASNADMYSFGRGLDEEARFGSSTEAFRKLAILQYHRAPAALQWIDHWSRRAKSRGLRERAENALSELATELGITGAELSERVMSDYGFDERGRQTIAWGARGQMTLSLGPNNEIRMHDDSGKLWKNYPGPLKDDDADAIKALKADVSSKKKEVKQATNGQVERMEYAMAAGREWAPHDWRGVYLANPLISNLAQHLLWCAFDADGTCHGFRIAEDLSLADLNDDAFDLAGHRVRVAHPYYLGEEAIRAWADVFADYERIPPFEQFERPLFTPEAKELEYSEVRRFEDSRTPATSFRGHMERRGWLRGAPQDGGAVMWMTKAFPAAEVTAVAWVEPGFSVASYDDWSEDQAVEKIQFIAGLHKDPGYRVEALSIADLEPVVFSEVILDLERLYGS